MAMRLVTMRMAIQTGRVVKKTTGLSRSMSAGKPAGMDVKKNLYVEEWDGLRSDVYKTYDLLNPWTALYSFIGVILIPGLIYKGCKWQQRIQDTEKYQRKGTQYFPE